MLGSLGNHLGTIWGQKGSPIVAKWSLGDLPGTFFVTFVVIGYENAKSARNVICMLYAGGRTSVRKAKTEQLLIRLLKYLKIIIFFFLIFFMPLDPPCIGSHRGAIQPSAKHDSGGKNGITIIDSMIQVGWVNFSHVAI